MAVTGWKAPGTAANVDRDSEAAWNNPNSAKADDANYADVDIDKADYSDWLRLTNFGFDTGDIPNGSTIDGIELEHKRESATENDIKDSVAKLRKTSGQVGDNKASAIYWTTKESRLYGGAIDTWNAGLIDSDIRSSDFGVDWSALSDNINLREGRVYFCQIRIYYTEAGGENHRRGSFFLAM